MTIGTRIEPVTRYLYPVPPYTRRVGDRVLPVAGIEGCRTHDSTSTPSSQLPPPRTRRKTPLPELPGPDLDGVRWGGVRPVGGRRPGRPRPGRGNAGVARRLPHRHPAARRSPRSSRCPRNSSRAKARRTRRTPVRPGQQWAPAHQSHTAIAGDPYRRRQRTPAILRKVNRPMVNRSKAKGTAWESTLRDYLQQSGWPTVERLPLSGALDRGDIAGIRGVVIEAKCEAGWDHLGAAIAEAERERVNARANLGVVWRKRVGRTAAAEGYVVMTGSAFVELLRRAGY